MSVVLQSSTSSAFNQTGSLVINKPSGLAVGDLLLAVITLNDPNVTRPAGWSRLLTSSSGAGNVNTIIDYIIATSTEVAASNFTWTGVGGQVLGGGLARIDGHHSTNPLGVSANDGTITATATPSFPITVTPNDASSLFLFVIGTYDNSNSTITSSTYAIVTSNPTWTEAFDLPLNGGGGSSWHTALASATRTQITATGNASATISKSCAQFAGIMIVVRPQITVTASETGSTTDSLSKILTKNVLEVESVVDTAIATKSKIWTNQTKNPSTWTNQTKN